MNARPVGTLAYTAEQMQDVRRRLQQAELQRDNALAALEASRADAERLARAGMVMYPYVRTNGHAGRSASAFMAAFESHRALSGGAL